MCSRCILNLKKIIVKGTNSFSQQHKDRNCLQQGTITLMKKRVRDKFSPLYKFILKEMYFSLFNLFRLANIASR